ncbi:MAG: DMT family transporter [Ruminococcaceae bacterium]|nr:DMT family transporter [Oscillospiraceae bacterium]
MKSKNIIANIEFLLAAAIWGFAFVAQKTVSETMSPFYFNAVRFLLGSISLIPVILIIDIINKNKAAKTKFYYYILFGFISGLILAIASSLQQIGIKDSTAGKTSFITGLYLVLVPILSIFFKNKSGLFSWIAIIPGVSGLYLLCVNESFTFSKGDLIVLSSTVFYALHILVIDRFSKKINPLKLSCIQFAFCGIFCFILSFILEQPNFEMIKASVIPILYGGLMSVGIAYTLQTVGQKNANPTHAAFLLSTESVFGAIGGIIILNERMTFSNILGCILIFSAIIISQIPLIFSKNKIEHTEASE